MVCQLHNHNIDKKMIPKYPINPFYYDYTQYYGNNLHIFSEHNQSISLLTCDDFLNTCEKMFAKQEVAIEEVSTLVLPTDLSIAPSSDILSRIAFEADLRGDVNGQPSEGVEMVDKQKATYTQVMPTDTAESDSYLASKVDLDKHAKISKQCISVAFYLYVIAVTLIFALIAIMIVTIITLRTEGYTWMEDTGNSIETQELISLRTISMAKAKFVKVCKYI
jgi:hypothetical protein